MTHISVILVIITVLPPSPQFLLVTPRHFTMVVLFEARPPIDVVLATLGIDLYGILADDVVNIAVFPLQLVEERTLSSQVALHLVLLNLVRHRKQEHCVEKNPSYCIMIMNGTSGHLAPQSTTHSTHPTSDGKEFLIA